MPSNVKILPPPVYPSREEIQRRVDALLETETLLAIAFDSLDIPPRVVLEVLDDVSRSALVELRDALRRRVGLGWT